MDELINLTPCGFLTLSREGKINTVNQTLLKILNYDERQLIGQHINITLTKSSQIFFQLYFTPLINVKHHVEEMYLSFVAKDGEEIPVLLNASLITNEVQEIIACVAIPMRKRSEFESQLLYAKKAAEAALKEKNNVLSKLENTLNTLQTKQEQLLEVNKVNQLFKIVTERELQLAKKVQETILPKDIKNNDLEIVSYYKASNSLSGDIYGYYEINPHQYGIILLDVMGHGISSALITMSLQSIYQRLISQGCSAQKVMQSLDSHLHQLFQNSEETRHYCTALYLFIDTEKQIIEYANAGHPPAVLLDTKGGLHCLSAQSPPIGMFDEIDFQVSTIHYNSGDRLFLYTDGVFDPLNLEILYDFAKKYKNLPLKQLKQQFIKDLKSKYLQYKKSDDQCLLVIDLN